MGCDIHCYIEYKNRKYKNDRWSSFGQQINAGRNYYLFAKMAGVRSYGNDIPVIVEPRGYPADAGYFAQCDNFLYIADSDSRNGDECSRDSAERWVARGASYYKDEKKNFVSHPDWHSHSWLTSDEFEQVLTESDGKMIEEPEYQAILAAMRAFEKLDYDTRLVFWFDN